MPRYRRDSAGSATGLIVVAISFLVVLLLSMWSFGVFAGGGGTARHPVPSVFSQSHSERQLRLCVEGRPSSPGGTPPTRAQQRHCTLQLERQTAGGAASPLVAVP